MDKIQIKIYENKEQQTNSIIIITRVGAFWPASADSRHLV